MQWDNSKKQCLMILFLSFIDWCHIKNAVLYDSIYIYIYIVYIFVFLAKKKKKKFEILLFCPPSTAPASQGFGP